MSRESTPENGRYSFFLQPFFEIIQSGNLNDLEKYLIDNEVADVPFDTKELNTGLVLAVDLNRLDMVGRLIDVGADVNGERDSTTPLMLAARNDNRMMVDLLLEKGADINRRQDRGLTAFHESVIRNDIEMARLLLFWNADPNIPTKKQEYPLVKATTISLAMTRLLIESGAQFSHDYSEVHVSILAHKFDITNYLLDQLDKRFSTDERKHILKPNKIGRSHLQSLCATAFGNDIDTVIELGKRLVNDWALDVNFNNRFGSIFHILALRGRDRMTNALLDYFLAIKYSDCEQTSCVDHETPETPLDIALKMDESIAIKLIRQGFASANGLELSSFYSFRDIHEDTKVMLTLFKLLRLEGARFTIPARFANPPPHFSPGKANAMRELHEWWSNQHHRVLSLQELTRIFIRKTYKKKTLKVMKETQVPHFISHYVLYGICCRPTHFIPQDIE